MIKQFFRFPENMSPQARNGFLIATAIAAAHFVAVPYYLYLAYFGQTSGISQFYILSAITIALGALFVLGATLSRRGRPTQGMLLVLGTLAVSYPPISATLVGGLGLVLGIALMVVGPMSAFQVLPRKSAWVMTVLTIISGLATLLLDVYGSAVRPSLPGIVIQILAAAVVLVLVYFIVRQLWNSNQLRNRIIVIMLVFLIPILGISTWYNIQAQRREMQAILTSKAETVAMSGAASFGTLLQEAIENGELTEEQAFDTNYVKYWKFDPASYEFDGNPESLNKYHTAYDAYTDEFWQGLVDAYLNQEEFVFTIPVDRNGYLPTHNTRWSSWDGSPATDRSKRIFNDPVGIKAAQNTEPTLVQIYQRPGTGETLLDVSAPIYVYDRHWGAFRVGTVLTSDNLFAKSAIQAATLRNIIALLILITGVFIISWFFGRYISAPLEILTDWATKFASGQLDQAVEIPNRAEVTVLTKAFNSMASQVKNLVGSLEQRVAERTHGLELAAEVVRSVTQVRSLDAMLKEATELIRSRFDLYYVQVYLTNSSQTALLLQSGTGTVGEQLQARAHQLPLNTASINGRAATEKRSVVIVDTSSSSTFRPNPLLPETRSEMAVPLMIGEKVVGVLDLQSQKADALNQEVLSTFEALAGQLAIAIQNATFLAETQQARAEVETQARRLSRANWNEYMDAIHRPEETGFVFEQNKISLMSAQPQPEPNENAMSAPIAVIGEALGNLTVEMEGEAPIKNSAELVSAVAHQISQQIESLRLLDTAERYRFEAEEASRRLTREGWKNYKLANTNEGLSYLYDLNEVRPYDQNKEQPAEGSTSLPLKVRDEIVGKLVIQGLGSNDTESLELVNAVAERLGAHIESLRQFDETQRGQIELDKRAHQLAAVAEVSSVSARELDIDKMLHSVVHLTQRKFGLYHCHVFIFNENTQELKIAACGYKEGDIHEGTDGTAVIPLAQEQSLVARAARTGQAVISNDVHHEAGWLPNPLLPDTQSEMAVSLIIGGQLLGVLDVQSDQLNSFSDEDASIYTTLASQVSTALQNARSFAHAQQQAQRESTLNLISQKIQSATTVEAVLQIAARELGHALGAPMTIAQLSMKDKK